MTDRDRVIEELEDAIDRHATGQSMTIVEQWVVRGAVALLKAHEPVKPNAIMHGKMVMYYQCPSCLATIDPSDNFCRRCGRAVKWDAERRENQ